MNKSTKEKIKSIGTLLGAAGGSCVFTYVSNGLMTFNPAVGIGAKIARFLISSSASAICAKQVSDMADAIIATADAVDLMKNKANENNIELEDDEKTGIA